MNARLRIAAVSSVVTLLLAILAAVLSFLLLFPYMGTGAPSVVTFLILPLLPALVAALATKLMSAYAERVSANAIFAAPTVLGCCAGLAAGALVVSESAQPIAFVALGLMPMAGAVAGSVIPWRAPPWAVGLVAGVIMLMLVFLMTQPR
jgi:hypothetical protein